MVTAVLNVKIDEALKERLRHYAEDNNENLSVTTEKLLLLAFEAVEEAGVSEEDVDNQHTEEESVTPFTPKEIKALRKLLKKKMKQQLSTASDYNEACNLLRSGYVKHVRLGWNVGSDEFFRIASDWCDTGAKIKKEGDNFIISLKGFPIPPQH